MGLESRARAWAHRRGLQKSRVVVATYRSISELRYRGAWDEDVTFRGHRFRIGHDLTLYPAVRNGGFEAHELDALLPQVPEDAVVWDVGANIGIYAVLLAAAAPRGHVTAFEPVPESHERLLGNLARNEVTNVTVERMALSNEVGIARMSVHPDAHGCDQIGVEDAEASRDDDRVAVIEVGTSTGDLYAAASGDPDVIKVDIEGHEPQFLEGAWGVLSRRRPLLMMEVNPTAWHGADDRLRWQETLDNLFKLYGEGDWFDADGRRRVAGVDVATLGPHADTVIFGASRP